jgi:predicted Zn-dependent protease
VLVKGTWGFAARVKLVPIAKATANWKSSFERDPFDVPLDTKIDFLLNLNAAAMKNPVVSFVSSSMVWVNEQRFLATSDGSRIEQYLIRGDPSFNLTAVNRATGDFNPAVRWAARRRWATNTWSDTRGWPRPSAPPRKPPSS